LDHTTALHPIFHQPTVGRSTAARHLRSIRLMSIQVLESFVGSMTVAEFCNRTGREVEELLAFCSSSRSSSRSSSPSSGRSQPKTQTAKAAKAPSKPRRRVNRSKGSELSEPILEAIRNADGLSSREIADRFGISTTDVRGALKPLISSRRVRHVGATKARRYFAA